MKTCPSDYPDWEISNLCENGPANYITIQKIHYWNQFCAECNGANVASSEPSSIIPTDVEHMEVKWNLNKLQSASPVTQSTTLQLLSALQPHLSDETAGIELTVGDESFVNLTGRVDITCSAFVDSDLDFCRQDNIDVEGQSEKYPVWNLGSISCYSPYQKVCEFYIQPAQKSNKTCSKLGCSEHSVLDPGSLECIDLKQFVSLYPQKGYDITWRSQPICDYHSRCKAAELGLIREEELNCYCDKFCIYFNDCCADSKYTANQTTILEPDVFGCYKDYLQPDSFDRHLLWGVTEITKCPSHYTENTTIIELCDQSLFWGHRNNLEWNLLKIPVTDTRTGLRYVLCKNHHPLYCFNRSYRAVINSFYAV